MSNCPARLVLDAAGEIAARRLVVSTAGNVSARSRGGMLITPSRRPYGQLRAEDLVLLGLDGAVLNEPTGIPSTEWRLHAVIYAARADVGGIVHTHSPYATAWSFCGESLTLETEDRMYFGLGDVNLAPFAPRGSAELADAAVQALGASPAVLLARHGVTGVAADPLAAVDVCSVVEWQAQVEWLVRTARVLA